MRRLLRGLLKLTGLASLGYAVYRLIARDDRHTRWEPPGSDGQQAQPTRPAERRPGAGTKPRSAAPGASRPGQPERPQPAVSRPAAPDGVAWVEPVDGACPVSHPVKAKMASGIYHVPEGSYYGRTRPDRCYRDPEAAEADGLRRAGR
jgi:hypothetical protein